MLSVLLKRRARGPDRLVWPGSGTGVLVVDYLVLGSVAEAVRGDYGLRARLGVVLYGCWLELVRC